MTETARSAAATPSVAVPEKRHAREPRSSGEDGVRRRRGAEGHAQADDAGYRSLAGGEPLGDITGERHGPTGEEAPQRVDLDACRRLPGDRGEEDSKHGSAPDDPCPAPGPRRDEALGERPHRKRRERPEQGAHRGQTRYRAQPRQAREGRAEQGVHRLADRMAHPQLSRDESELGAVIEGQPAGHRHQVDPESEPRDQPGGAWMREWKPEADELPEDWPGAHSTRSRTRRTPVGRGAPSGPSVAERSKVERRPSSSRSPVLRSV